MKTNRLRAYGSTALGTTALLASHADAATAIDVNATTYNTGLSGIGVVGRSGDGSANSTVTFSSYLAKQSGGYFRRASDTAPVTFQASGSSRNFFYADASNVPVTPKNGAVLNSSDNWFYAGSSDNTQRVWLQFQFGGAGDGTNFSIVKAVFPATIGELSSPESAAAVPEPSALALLSLGASGLLVRRRKRAA